VPANPAASTTTIDEAAATSAIASLDCGTSVAGLDPLLVPGTIVMLGEIHARVLQAGQMKPG